MKNKSNIKTYLILGAAIIFILYLASISRSNWSDRRATETANATKAAATTAAKAKTPTMPLWYGTIYCELCLDNVPVLMWKAPFAIGTEKESDLAGMTYDKDIVRILEEKNAFGKTWYLIRLVPEGDTGWVMEHLIIPD